MKRPSIMTIVVIICIIIIGMYAMGEVNYFASKIVVERNVESPTVVIPSIGVQEKINTMLWCEEDSLYYDRLFDGRLTRFATPSPPNFSAAFAVMTASAVLLLPQPKMTFVRLLTFFTA